jgi:hypothetical protein
MRAQSAIGTAHGEHASKGLSIALWVVQALLAAGFLMAGGMKVAQKLPNVPPGSETLFLIAGIAEVLGAVGLILPAATRIRPGLTPLAALGLFVVMVLAFAFELAHGGKGIAPIVLGALAAFVAWGRFKAAPIAPRE